MIGPLRAVVLLCVLGLGAGSCTFQNFSFVVPAQVAVGSVFAIEVHARFGSPTGMPPAAVFHLPDAFEFVGAAAAAHDSPTGTVYPFPDAGGASPPMNFSSPLSMWGAATEPAHHLLWFSAYDTTLANVASSAILKVYFRAPATAGAHTLKLALGYRDVAASYGHSYFHALPTGAIGFAAITTSDHVRAIQVVAAPPPPPFGLVAVPAVPGTPLPRGVVAIDLDADGRDDLVERHDQHLRVLLSRSGGWQPAATLAVPSGAARVAAGDLDGDAFGDLVLATGEVHFGDGGGTWAPAVSLPHGLPVADVAVGDVDGDGSADVVFADAMGCAVFRANADRSFTPFGNGLPVSTGSQPGRVRVDDLDGDGLVEVLLWSLPGQPVALWRTDGLGNWSLAGTLVFPGAVPHAIDDDPFVTIDLDGDGRREILRSGSSTGYTFTGTGVAPTSTMAFVFDRAVALDHDRDGHTDLVTTPLAGAGSLPTLWSHLGGGQFQPSLLSADHGFRVLDRTLELRAADVDGDSFPDIVGLFTVERTAVWRNTSIGGVDFGLGCAGGPFAAPQLGVLGTVAPGRTVTLQIAGALPNGPGLVWAGLSRRTWVGLPLLPLDLGFVGAPGCALLAEPLVIVPVAADGAGVLAEDMALPAVPFTESLTFFVQGAVFAPGANAAQFLFSQGAALKMQ